LAIERRSAENGRVMDNPDAVPDAIDELTLLVLRGPGHDGDLPS
jgi:hypothetical protein